MAECCKLVSVQHIQNDILHEVPNIDIPVVLEKLKTDWPHSMPIYNFIEMRLNWKKQDSQECFHMFCPKGSWNTVICISATDENLIAVYTLEESCNQLCVALNNTKVINWKTGFIHVSFLHEKHKDQLVKVLHTKIPLESDYDYINCTFYHMTSDRAMEIQTNLPSEFSLRALDESYAQTVFDSWHHKEETTVSYVKKLLKYNYSIGMFTRDSGELVCWILDTDYGLGMLHTPEKHRRKGYAKVLVQHAFKELGTMGRDIGLHIMNLNQPSRNLFRNILGCTPVAGTTWIVKSYDIKL